MRLFPVILIIISRRYIESKMDVVERMDVVTWVGCLREECIDHLSNGGPRWNVPLTRSTPSLRAFLTGNRSIGTDNYQHHPSLSPCICPPRALVASPFQLHEHLSYMYMHVFWDIRLPPAYILSTKCQAEYTDRTACPSVLAWIILHVYTQNDIC